MKIEFRSGEVLFDSERGIDKEIRLQEYMCPCYEGFIFYDIKASEIFKYFKKAFVHFHDLNFFDCDLQAIEFNENVRFEDCSFNNCNVIVPIVQGAFTKCTISNVRISGGEMKNILLYHCIVNTMLVDGAKIDCNTISIEGPNRQCPENSPIDFYRYGQDDPRRSQPILYSTPYRFHDVFLHNCRGDLKRVKEDDYNDIVIL